MRMTKRLSQAGLLIISLMLVGLLAGCSIITPGAAQIPGNYKLKLPDGEELLILRSNGSYEQQIRIRGYQEVIHDGTYDYYEDGSLVVGDGFITIYDIDGNLIPNFASRAQPESSDLSVARDWRGRIDIAGDGFEGADFVRQ